MEMFRESWIILWTSPILVIAIGAELVASNLAGRPVYSWRGVLENIYLTSLNLILDVGMRSLSLVALYQAYSHRLISWNHNWIYWCGLLLAQDFAYYWLHRLDHSCRLFWAIHVTHHSAEQFNITVGFRSSVFQPLYRFVFFLPISLLGWSPQDVLLMYSITQIYGLFIHTECVNKLGWLEYILVTPSHHRVHHGSNPEYLDRNMGMVFIFWDKWFGTFTPELSPVQYGITKKLGNRSATNLVFHDWREMANEVRAAKGLSSKIKLMLGPPGNRSPDETKPLIETFIVESNT